MAQQYPEQPLLQITGLNTAGHPLLRPKGSTYECDNFRVMPGGWLRLRGGRKLRLEQSAGKFIQLYPYKWPPEMILGSVVPESHWVQHRENATDVFWKSISMGTYAMTSQWEIETTHDEGWALENPVAAVTINYFTIFYNGMGVRDWESSRPPLMTYQHDKNAMRYFGLDLWCSNLWPGAVWNSSVTNGIVCEIERRLWVGLRNAWSGHYSNAMHVATFGPQTAPGSITVNDMQRIKFPTPSPQDGVGNGLNFVFYMTIDGGQVPYLIMDATTNYIDPVMAPMDVDSFTLTFPTVPAGLKGVYLDPTKEMPTTNFPPKPMKSMCYVGGRVYGALLPNAGYQYEFSSIAMPTQPDPVMGARTVPFSYDTRWVGNRNQLRGVVWSNAARDAYDHDFVGVPEESWPQDFFSFTPSGEEPVVLDDAKTRVLVICPSSCFLLEETADGIHEWTEISAIRGIENPKTLTKTTYGHVWVTQHKEIVLLPLDSASLVVLSEGYQSVIDGNPVCGTYMLDVRNQVDRYQMWMDNGKSICHDFKLQVSYTESPNIYDCAKTLTRSDGTRVYCVANQSLYTIEGQPENGLVPTMDEAASYEPGTPRVPIEGLIRRNWDDFGDAVVRKDFSWVDVIVGSPELTMEWAKNFRLPATSVAAVKTTQSPDDYLYRFKMISPTAFWYQFGFRLPGTSTNEPAYYPIPGDEGNLIPAVLAKMRGKRLSSQLAFASSSTKPSVGAELNVGGPLYSAIQQAWAFNEGGGSILNESRHAYTATINLDGAQWISDPEEGTTLEINGGYAYPATPHALIPTTGTANPGAGFLPLSAPLPTLADIVSGPTADIDTSLISIVMRVKIYNDNNYNEARTMLIFKSLIDPDNSKESMQLWWLQQPIWHPGDIYTNETWFLFRRYWRDDFANAQEEGFKYPQSLLFDGEWHTIIVVTAPYDTQGEWKLYIDGVEQPHDLFSGPAYEAPYPNEGHTLQFGAIPADYNYNIAHPLWGQIGTVQFYNRQLTPAEVADLTADPYMIWEEGDDGGGGGESEGNFYGAIMRVMYQAGNSSNRT